MEVYSRTEIANRLRVWRTRNHFSRNAALDLLGWHWVTLYQWENPAWDMPDVVDVTEHTRAQLEKLTGLLEAEYRELLVVA